jgi:uncharacterized membrane protein
MNTFESSITINKPIEDVFAAAVDLASHSKWRDGLLDASFTSAGPVGPNATYVYRMRTMGRTIVTNCEVVAYTPPTGYAWKSTSGPFPIAGRVLCEAMPEGTRITEVLEVEPGGFFKLAEPVLFRQQQSRMEKDLIRLKELLESG